MRCLGLILSTGWVMGITKDVFKGALLVPFLFPAFDQRSFAHRDLNSNKKASYAEKRLSYSDRLIPITRPLIGPYTVSRDLSPADTHYLWCGLCIWYAKTLHAGGWFWVQSRLKIASPSPRPGAILGGLFYWHIFVLTGRFGDIHWFVEMLLVPIVS